MPDRLPPEEPVRAPAPAPVEDPWRNLPLLAALVVAGLEAVALVVVAVGSVVSAAREGWSGAAVAIALAVVLLLFVLLLVAGINALWHGRRWGRGPVLTWQLIQAAIAVGAVGEGPAWAVYPALAASLAVAAGLLLPASVAATNRPSSSSSSGTGTVL
ncbi:hypothetical protein [Actinotalea caeni]|uniref:hypothetical protein n=1 Tax=Actinotalea caeni TaxID=1348467 RepID=UPI0012E265AC|nr:hypothetical protein [Actinotalea caeni]